MYDVNHLPSTLEIGYTNERYFRKLEVDISDWIAEMPAGTAAIVYLKPGNSSPTRPAVSTVNGILTWNISDYDVGEYVNSKEGVGAIQLEMSETVNDYTRIRKSEVIRVLINQGLNYYRGA